MEEKTGVRTIADIIKNARLCKGYTQQELATISGIALRTISNIETGKIKKPVMATLHKLMESLNIAPNDLAEVCEYVNSQTLANIIKSARLRKGLTQGELARMCGISIVDLSDIEAGKLLKPKLRVLKVLSNSLDLDFDKLMKICGYSDQEIEKEFADRVRSARLYNGISQKELADKCGISMTYLSYIENGKIKNIDPRLREELKKNLNLDQKRPDMS